MFLVVAFCPGKFPDFPISNSRKAWNMDKEIWLCLIYLDFRLYLTVSPVEVKIDG